MKARVDRILNLLIDEIEERLRTRELLQARERLAQRAAESPSPEFPVVKASIPPVAAPVAPVEATTEPQSPEPESEPALPPVSLGPSHATRLMGRLALGLLVAVVAINIPFNRHGATLATAMPDSAAIVIRDGLVVKEEDDEEIYVYQDEEFRWISSMDAFEHYGFTWGDVRIVKDGFLDQFEKGTPLHALLKCGSSPHIYRLEGGEKRWIRDIATFEAEGHLWEDVRFVGCGYLSDLPDGETIPPGSGPPPQP